MIEKTLIAHLSAELEVPVYMEMPINKPSEFVTLQKIDAGIINKINASTFDVRCFSTSLQKAGELCETVKKALLDAIRLDEICSCRLGGENSNIDTTTKTYAYECVFNIYHY